MRITNTSEFVDSRATNLYPIYEDRVGCCLVDIEPQMFASPLVVKAVAELRLYHLPPYFDIPVHIKRNFSQGYYGIPSDHIALEAFLMSPSSIPGTTRHTLASYDISENLHAQWLQAQYKFNLLWKGQKILSIQDWVTSTPDIEGPSWAINFISEHTCHKNVWRDLQRQEAVYFLKLEQHHQSSDAWSSPKTALLAMHEGCSICSNKLPKDDIWMIELPYYLDGICTDCYYSNQNSQYRYSPYSPVLKHCRDCETTEYPYGAYGRCTRCYMAWQDSYMDPVKLLQIAHEYGQLATLLISTSNYWPTYLSKFMLKAKTFSQQQLDRAKLWEPKMKTIKSFKETGICLDHLMPTKPFVPSK